MQTNSSLRSYGYKRDAGNVGLMAQTNVKRKHIKSILTTILGTTEYLTYGATFLFLMALRVIPEYPNVSDYNPISWYRDVEIFGAYMLLLFMILGIHAFTLLQEKLFSGKEESSFIDEVIFSTRSIIYAFLLSVGITFLLKTTTVYSRVTLVLFLILMIAESILWRVINSVISSKLYARGIITKRVLIVGAGKVGNEVQQALMKARTKKT
ncbi:nucleoside-diphosphate sugar epimerase/dehydratase [Cohnella rhizosphaerae]|uniref:Undecaprenyl-phosphate glucose phosphotransferase n=1 Tax=Cohnella rhizosphaerae TaxID=1457232 RepID=A0A9X4QUR9_9BACL|nr:hypothetical protein [Cohnella rhizosphaerae]MDG0811799.1 hypothetical protein [Cohnella rhizosphaerae]